MSRPFPPRVRPDLSSEYCDPRRFQLNPELLSREPSPDPATDTEGAIQYLIDGIDPDIEAYAFISPAVQRQIAAEKLGLDEVDEAYEAALKRARSTYWDTFYDEATLEDGQRERQKQQPQPTRYGVFSEPLAHYLQRGKPLDELGTSIQAQTTAHFRAVYSRIGKLTTQEVRSYAPVHYQIAAQVGQVLGSLLIARLDDCLPPEERLHARPRAPQSDSAHRLISASPPDIFTSQMPVTATVLNQPMNESAAHCRGV